MKPLIPLHLFLPALPGPASSPGSCSFPPGLLLIWLVCLIWLIWLIWVVWVVWVVWLIWVIWVVCGIWWSEWSGWSVWTGWSWWSGWSEWSGPSFGHVWFTPCLLIICLQVSAIQPGSQCDCSTSNDDGSGLIYRYSKRPSWICGNSKTKCSKIPQA